MNSAFINFQASLITTRVLKGHDNCHWMLDAAADIMKEQSYPLPSVVYEDDNMTCLRMSSYARTPGMGVKPIEDFIQNTLPEDFCLFHQQYAEALVVTRTHPIHLWPVETIMEWLHRMRFKKPYPLRFLRFGDQWGRDATQYALWQPTPGIKEWRVVTTSVEENDDRYDDAELKDYYKLGNSFGEWLEDWIKRDGLPDPFMQIGPEGGFLDPV
jgi:hypothetical protein